MLDRAIEIGTGDLAMAARWFHVSGGAPVLAQGRANKSVYTMVIDALPAEGEGSRSVREVAEATGLKPRRAADILKDLESPSRGMWRSQPFSVHHAALAELAVQSA